jgi:hypothetical protein
MVGARGPAGQALQAEADLITAYDEAQNRIIAQVKATMPTERLRPFGVEIVGIARSAREWLHDQTPARSVTRFSAAECK